MRDWHVDWMNSWAHESQGDESRSRIARRFGRIIEPNDMSFSSQDVITDGAVLQYPHGEFVINPIGDTRFPALDTVSEVGASLDSVERHRWQITGDIVYRNGWRVWHRQNELQLKHPCYDGDFVLEVRALPLRRTGSYIRSAPARSFNGFGMVIDAWGRLYIAATGYLEHKESRAEWQGRYYGRAYLFLVTDTPSPQVLEMIPIPDEQTDVRYRVVREGSQLRFGWLIADGNFGFTGWVPAGTGRFPVRFDGVQVHAP